MGKSTISMAIFNSYVDITRGYFIPGDITWMVYCMIWMVRLVGFGWAMGPSLVFLGLLQTWFVWKCWVNIPNEIAIFHRDNDQQNHWVKRGTSLFSDKPTCFSLPSLKSIWCFGSLFGQDLICISFGELILLIHCMSVKLLLSSDLCRFAHFFSFEAFWWNFAKPTKFISFYSTYLYMGYG